jgi:Resolvase, N terminal domain
MKLGCYARVSTHEQQTLTLQRDAMITYAQQRGWTIVVMVEEVSSGARERRQRQELLRAVGAGPSMPLWSGGWIAGAGRSRTSWARSMSCRRWA